jgi:hypothetical protein
MKEREILDNIITSFKVFLMAKGKLSLDIDKDIGEFYQYMIEFYQQQNEVEQDDGH